MASPGKRRIIGLSAAVLVLALGMGIYEFWLHMALRDHPWQLESFLDILAADCRTGPGTSVFSEELRALTAQVNEAKFCLTQTNETWAVGRDFTPCFNRLLRASLTALRIRKLKWQRLQEEKARLNLFLKTLEFELNSDAFAKQTGAKFEIRHVAQSQARTFLEEARNLAALGRTESALIAVLRARTAWGLSETFRAAELSRFYQPENLALWDTQAQDMLRWTRQSGRSAILVDKLEHRCYLLADGRVEKSYGANLGRNWHRDKVQELDASTPEGEYKIKRKFRSATFGWALLLDYPNASDRQRFNSMKKAGEITARARIGGNIEIHGRGRLNSDWTDGCVSLEDIDMADLYKHAYPGMPVAIVGTCRLELPGKE
jgi:L,D-peptidoglycan transpeptidase YkuD (ErfK/YbiS/YcfS/YnhG family)